MRRFSKFLAPLVAVLAIAGCGGGSSSHVSHPAAAAPGPHLSCSPYDQTMNCVLGQVGAPASSNTGGTKVVATGIDFGWGGPSVSTFKANGWTFGASYLSNDSSKNWSRAQVNAYHAAGISTVAVWESTANRATGTRSDGVVDARAAAAEARALGFAATRPIYFAIDCDCTGPSVANYFDGVKSVLGVKRTGVYGGIRPVSYLFDTHRVTYAWQTYAWSGGAWDGRAQLRQWLNGSSVDYDRAMNRDFGQSPYSPPAILPLCYHRHITRYQCNLAKNQVAHDQRAASASEAVYIHLGGPVLAQRISWYSHQLKVHPKVKTAYRKRALASSRRAWSQRHLSVYRQRFNWFLAQVGKIEQSN